MFSSLSSSITIQVPDRTLRWITIMGGLAVFLWLAPEDNQLVPVTLLGIGIALIIVMHWLKRNLNGQTLSVPRFMLLGLLPGTLTGLASSLVIVGLMLLKNAQHSHLYPDFPIGLMGAMLARAPVWMIAGGLIGTGLACIHLMSYSSREN
jgi:hypothetical protein